MLPGTPGTQMLPGTPGTQMLPGSPGTQMLPGAPGTQMLPAAGATQVLRSAPPEVSPFQPVVPTQMLDVTQQEVAQQEQPAEAPRDRGFLEGLFEDLAGA